ncbi:unnamed protein product [Citrullus colocynthis]|uniref:Uncharacterized protein n=1 Tax=Citrullus colocynthis TaxID=252529 RepID=A0ABP0YAW0_9ROSI
MPKVRTRQIASTTLAFSEAMQACSDRSCYSPSVVARSYTRAYSTSRFKIMQREHTLNSSLADLTMIDFGFDPSTRILAAAFSC